jgi:putative zinc finger/helix-turn-helix YgiT family protein
MKRPYNAERPFPWRCRHCGKNEVEMETMEYTAEVRYEGRLHTFKISKLQIPVCQSCKEKVFTEDVDQQVNDALRLHLKLLTPFQIRDALKRLHLTQKGLSEHLGVAEETLSRWTTGTVIQSRAMDNLMRIYFKFPQVREALSDTNHEAILGPAYPVLSS